MPPFSLRRSEASRPFCAFCREALDSRAADTCCRCGVGIHADCALELEGCPTLGCAEDTARGSADERTEPATRALRSLISAYASRRLLLSWLGLFAALSLPVALATCVRLRRLPHAHQLAVVSLGSALPAFVISPSLTKRWGPALVPGALVGVAGLLLPGAYVRADRLEARLTRRLRPER